MLTILFAIVFFSVVLYCCFAIVKLIENKKFDVFRDELLDCLPLNKGKHRKLSTGDEYTDEDDELLELVHQLAEAYTMTDKYLNG